MQSTSSISDTPVSAEAKELRRKQALSWFLAVLFLLLFTGVLFNRTIFRGQPITAVNYVAHLDTAFDTTLPEMWLPVVYDQTPQTILYPNERFFKVAAESGNFPFWNDKNACGIPLLGDFNAFVFSPIAWVKAYCTPYVYNLVLVVLVFIGAIMSLFVARRLGLAPLPALFAAICYGFNPGVIRYTELHNNNFLVPIILLAVLKLGARSFWHSVALGVVCGIIPYIMHAECAFSAVAFAWLFLLVQNLLQSSSKSAALKSYFLSLGLAGLLGVALALPALLPFVEFCTNSVCYKSVVDWVRDVQFPALLLNLVSPVCGGGSFFSGVILLGLAYLGVTQKDPRAKALAIVAFINMLLISRLPPFAWLLSNRPFNFFMPVYATSPFILFVALLAAYGLQGTIKGDKQKTFVAAVLMILSASLPLLYLALKVNLRVLQFDCFPLEINLKETYVQSLLAGAGAVLLLASLQFKFYRELLLQPVLIALTIISMGTSLKQALPATPAFDYKPTDLISYLQAHDGRILGLGFHMLVPNLNEVYGIKDFRVTNPFMPARYLKYLHQAGGKREGLNEFRFSAKSLGKELDMASVKYIIAQPPLDQELTEPRFKLAKECEGKIRVYENTQALPESYLVYKTRLAGDLTDSLAAIKSPDFVPGKEAVVESTDASDRLSHEQVPDNSRFARLDGETTIKRPGPQTVEVTAHAQTSAFLILNDTYYPGWHATIDGVETKIYPANAMFRAVKFPSGTHTVIFQYRPGTLNTGLMICGIVFASIAAIGAFQKLRKPKAAN